mmetsp:Transcript_2788/g.6018  ORF Transcript_2788/g.6018 Transcript_2788/m.6018 type:complete len:89 (-) Transcript_2788:95-361(-)
MSLQYPLCEASSQAINHDQVAPINHNPVRPLTDDPVTPIDDSVLLLGSMFLYGDGRLLATEVDACTDFFSQWLPTCPIDKGEVLLLYR